ncbi:MAG: proline--tRNA ligase [Candidatus Margulisbacteria bacterium]|nr:proline--tRNA ligase [Candidatus Margulisiibacteriota bacterium]
MKFSKLYCPTLKETPKDALVASHQLMMRSGMIRKLAAGIYSYLPLGLKIMRKIECIVREEMNRSGAQEILMPSVIPSELWKETGRWDLYGKELLRLKDRASREFCYGPTHEEVITDIVRNNINSYKQLPMNLYQIQTKFRDEIRPRFGLMRGREFIMKDAYSFHTSESCLEDTFQEMENTYGRIFSRAGLNFKIVEADSGNIGGSGSREFMVTAESGEDAILECDHCQYSANVEVAEKSGGTSEGDRCGRCKKGSLSITRGIEVGHIFKLGDKYSKVMTATVLDDKGNASPIMMGCYGIGIGRTMAAAIEQHHDERGIKWPLSLAPFLVDIILIKAGNPEQMKIGEKIYEDLTKENIDVLLDDRELSPGIKFKDADLIGIPFQLIIGNKTIENQTIELKSRKSGEVQILNLSDIISTIKGVTQ